MDRNPQNRPNDRNNPRNNQGPAEPKPFDERVMHIDRVARVVKGGRRFRFRALTVVGDRKGSVGIGTAKGADVTTAVAKSVEVAKKNMVKIHLYKNTLPHEATGKVSGAVVFLKPASAGTGLIAGGVVRTVVEVAGVHDVLSKSLGSTNKTNIAYATIAALQSMEPSNRWITKNHEKQTASKTKADKTIASTEPKTEAKAEPAKKAATKAPTKKTPAKAKK